jgi:hypothetical protein
VLYNVDFVITIKFKSHHNVDSWKRKTVYGPCQGPRREEFFEWLNNMDTDPEENWLILGDFNFYRSVKARNKLGGGGELQQHGHLQLKTQLLATWVS